VDTRNKILTPARALAISERPVVLVTGTFDVLRAEHARELEEARFGSVAALLVVVLPGAGEVLPQRARAELVAALRAVDYVVAAGAEELAGFIQALEPVFLVRLEDGDERRVRQLREEIRARVKTGTHRGDAEARRRGDKTRRRL
jgi:glycerol-3-phosphate cytidylyltransferase-like family protein